MQERAHRNISCCLTLGLRSKPSGQVQLLRATSPTPTRKVRVQALKLSPHRWFSKHGFCQFVGMLQVCSPHILAGSSEQLVSLSNLVVVD
ncbi:hypothetical protein BKA82DRAFT_768184 [Pisolithus tinctorius]|uniref:Uncharacterized protein n=1 Tax=Pisolithus tinctorius Marx 270 TaxID=870435 RepID=A0A0C3NYA6_PISTI|nr:hypothetical protein BKA82DRAFT_768184 [Pisolithus tinctorius]KIO00291.1 hypothetical protein M404DRAFT_768184 [Pisolithus tinctorius Marx 270]